jgi:hypothetical protein
LFRIHGNADNFVVTGNYNLTSTIRKVPINTHKLQTDSNVTQITLANNSLTAEGTEFVTWRNGEKGSQQDPHVRSVYKMAKGRQGNETCRKVADTEVEMQRISQLKFIRY